MMCQTLTEWTCANTQMDFCGIWYEMGQDFWEQSFCRTASIECGPHLQLFQHSFGHVFRRALDKAKAHGQGFAIRAFPHRYLHAAHAATSTRHDVFEMFAQAGITCRKVLSNAAPRLLSTQTHMQPCNTSPAEQLQDKSCGQHCVKAPISVQSIGCVLSKHSLLSLTHAHAAQAQMSAIPVAKARFLI